MAKGISIGVASDTREFSKGIKSGVIEPLEDAGDALDDVARNGETAGDKLEKAMKDAGRETSDFKREQVEAGKQLQKTTDTGKKEFKELGDVIDRETKTAGKSFGKNVKDGTDEASDGLKDFKDEAASTARETAASFDGSFESVVGSVQEISANAFAGFGPLGAVAGLAAAAGIGTGFAMMQQDAEATKERIAEAFDDMVESGKSYASESFINDSLKEIITDSGKLSTAQEDAASLGVDLSTVLRAQAGDASALNEVIGASNDKYAAIRDRQREISETGAPIPGELQGQAVAAEALADKYAGLAGDLTTAAGQAAVFRDAQVGAGSASEIAKGQVDAFNSAVSQIQASKSLDINVNTAAAEAALAQLARNRTVQIDVSGNITRIGNQVW